MPTFREAGVAMEVYSWSCVMAPAKVPADVLDKLHAALGRALDDPEVMNSIASTGGERFNSTHEEAKKFLTAERKLWGNLIRERKIQGE